MIRIIAVDDERLARNALVKALTGVFPEADIKDFSKAGQCMDYIHGLSEEKENLEYAFLDIQMGGMTGVELARQIKDIFPQIRILFVTAYNHYAYEAFQLQVKGYILKPVSEENIKEALDNMEVDWKKELDTYGEKRLQVNTFGNFEVSVDGKTLDFTRKKSKELLALLIDRMGESVSNEEIMELLWREEEAELHKKSYLRKIKSDLIKTLKAAEVEDIIVKDKHGLSVNINRIDCDYFLFMQGHVSAINSYHGIYMEEYSWAEFTTAYLTSQKAN